jgi:hypothetical protein
MSNNTKQESQEDKDGTGENNSNCKQISAKTTNENTITVEVHIGDTASDRIM